MDLHSAGLQQNGISPSDEYFEKAAQLQFGINMDPFPASRSQMVYLSFSWGRGLRNKKMNTA
jgi:hypothetical protein